MRLGARVVARMAAGAVLQAPQCTQNVRRPAAESSESPDSITEAADGRRGLPERLCRFVAKGDPVVHQSGNGSSIVTPSFATTVSLNTARAAFTNSSALIEYRAETWLRTSRR